MVKKEGSEEKLVPPKFVEFPLEDIKLFKNKSVIENEDEDVVTIEEKEVKLIFSNLR